MKSNFLLGVNYWASNAGIKMWADFDINIIEEDLKLLHEHGVNTIRIFPLWNDFQPLAKHYTYQNEFQDFVYENDCALPFNKEGKAGIDKAMIERFGKLLDISNKYSIKVIVGLITGWMSGRIFEPKALIGKNLITDPEAIRIQVKYVQYIVDAFKDRSEIVAWDFGNECNCLQQGVTDDEAFVWCNSIYNAIYKIDSTRPVFSGMHSTVNDTSFSIKMLGETTDVMCTHPYPFFTKHCLNGNFISFRTLMHSSCITSMNEDFSEKPAIVEEIGTLGSMFCGDEDAGKFAKMNMFESLSQGFKGFLWWCGFDKGHLNYAPYNWYSHESELGIVSGAKSPKPIALAMKEFSNLINENKLNNLPCPTKKAVCILTKGQDKWSVGYGTYMLARQAGFNIKFCDNDMEIPKAELYMMPSIKDIENLHKSQLNDILNRVKDNGAKLYVSFDSRAFLRYFKEICGIEIQNVSERSTDFVFNLENEEFKISSDYRYDCKVVSAKVLADSNNGPIMLLNNYGKGEIYILLLPLERIVAESHDFVSDEEAANYYKIYNAFGLNSNVTKTYKNIAINEQVIMDRILITATNAGINYMEKFTIGNGYILDEIIKGENRIIDETVVEFNIEKCETVMFFIKQKI